MDFNKIKTYPIKERKNKFNIKKHLIPLDYKPNTEIKELKVLADKIKEARNNNKQIILMMGAHSIKVGLSMHLISLIKKRFITHIAMNGATSIHDFEVSLIGETSEDVAVALEDGSFGMADETGRLMNNAIKNSEEGYGQTIAKLISDSPYKNYSIMYNAYKLNIPVTVHVAIGTDIIHQHPTCDGSAIGNASYKDFKILTESISKAEDGIIINLGSAVILPEVFLKALTISRNITQKPKKIITANLDMIQHYRPTENIVTRPTSLGGQGFNIIQKHEITVPLLYNYLR